MIEFERLYVSINFKEGVRSDRLHYDIHFKYNLGEWITDLLVTTCQLKREEVSVDMVSIEKFISEVWYEEGNFRIVSTKMCKALLQFKENKPSDDRGFQYRGIAWFSTGTLEECINKAKEEMNKIKTKRRYREFIEGDRDTYSDEPDKRGEHKKNKKKVSKLTPEQLKELAQMANEPDLSETKTIIS